MLVNGIIVIVVVARIGIIDDDRIGVMSLNQSLNDWSNIDLSPTKKIYLQNDNGMEKKQIFFKF